MKIRRFLILILTISIVVSIGNISEYKSRNKIYSDSYPEVICPDIGGGTNLQVSLTNSSKLVRSLSRASVKMVPAKTTRISSNSGSVLVDGQGVNSVAWISLPSTWSGGLTCLSPQTQQYFVGASADVSSKSQLLFVNSGLSSSTVDVTVFTDANASFKKSITVKKNQTVNLSVVSLAPGAKSVAFMVTPRTGRVVAFLVDVRGKGLQALGGDIVNSQSELNKTIYIPAIAHSADLDKTHVLRILNPNASSANISVELISADGRYVPIALDNKNIGADRVLDLPFEVDSKNSAFALKITSDQPIAASVYSRVIKFGKRDFVWSSAVNPGVTGTWAITGLDPTLIITGGAIKADVRVLMPGGKQIRNGISASDIYAYKIPTGALGLSIQSLNSDNAAALLVYSQSGAGYIPLINGSVLTRSTVPTANIGVLNP